MTNLTQTGKSSNFQEIKDAAQELFLEISENKNNDEIFHGRVNQYSPTSVNIKGKAYTLFRVGRIDGRRIYIAVNDKTKKAEKVYETFTFCRETNFIINFFKSLNFRRA